MLEEGLHCLGVGHRLRGSIHLTPLGSWGWGSAAMGVAHLVIVPLGRRTVHLLCPPGSAMSVRAGHGGTTRRSIHVLSAVAHVVHGHRMIRPLPAPGRRAVSLVVVTVAVFSTTVSPLFFRGVGRIISPTLRSA